jgi:hypothetical protein
MMAVIVEHPARYDPGCADRSGPTPIFTASAPACASAFAPVAVPTYRRSPVIWENSFYFLMHQYAGVMSVSTSRQATSTPICNNALRGP